MYEKELLEELKELFQRIHAEVSLMREDFAKEKESSFLREFESVKTRNELFWQIFTHVLSFVAGAIAIYLLKHFGG